MSAPHQPSDRPRQSAPPGTAEPANHGRGRRASPAEPGPNPPIIDDDLSDCEPNPGGDEVAPGDADPAPPSEVPRLQQPPRGKRIGRKADAPAPPLTGEQRLLLLDTWRRSGLPAGDFAALVGMSKHTLYAWKQRFEAEGPAGLADKPKGGPTGSRLPEVTRRAILMLKEDNPDWGCERISALLLRGSALPASPQAVARVLHEAGYQTEEAPTHPNPDKVRRFERERANQLWQTDLFTFVLKRQNRRVYLVAFMDDHSRFLVGYGLHASQSGALVLEVFRAGLGSLGRCQCATMGSAGGGGDRVSRKRSSPAPWHIMS
jgi:transposase